MLTSVFGISIKYEAWNHQDSLPVYIAGSYDFHTAYIGNRRCIMLTPTEELATLPALKKQIVKIQQIDNVPVVFELTTVSNYRRKSLIENNIPFITDKQVFLPFIGTMLSDEKEPQKLTGKFVYSTQQLFLFYLYSKKKRLYISEAGKVLPFTAMTLTRAVKQLETTDLFLVAKDGVNKFIESKYKRDELFEKAKVYLTTPVRKTGYIDKTQVTENMVFAGETALSEKTMLNPSRVVTYAISEKDYDKALLTDELIDPDKQVRLELWAYNPKQFSEDNSADDISIVLSFGDTSLFLTTYRGGSHLPTDILFSLIELGCKEHTNTLENLYKYNKQYNRNDHNTCLIAVISVTNGNITKPATADTTCHCRISKNGSDCDSCSGK